MTASSRTADPAEVSAALAAAVDDAMALDLTSMSSREIATLLQGWEIAANRQAIARQRLVAELDARGAHIDFGVRSTPELVGQLLRVSPREATRRVADAKTFAPGRALSGVPLEPVVPIVAAALETGEVSLPHGRVIAKLLDELPGDVEAEFGVEVQEFLLEQAAQVDPLTLGKLAVRLRDTLDPDGEEDRARARERRRSFRLIVNPDGSSKPTGYLTPAATTVWRTILDPLSKPQPSTLGERDDRLPGQRMHDALYEAGRMLLRSDCLPDSGGTPTTVVVTITAQQLRDQLGSVSNAFGDLLPISEMLKLAREAEIIPVVLDDCGGVLAYGRTRRFASPGQRKALIARDGGCIMPGCTRPASWTEAHHVIDWINGGETNLGNLALLCGYDHDTFEARGWVITMIDGVPWCIPPKWLDPAQRPIRNTAHNRMHLEIPAELTDRFDPRDVPLR